MIDNIIVSLRFLLSKIKLVWESKLLLRIVFQQSWITFIILVFLFYKVEGFAWTLSWRVPTTIITLLKNESIKVLRRFLRMFDTLLSCQSFLLFQTHIKFSCNFIFITTNLRCITILSNLSKERGLLFNTWSVLLGRSVISTVLL